jgi:hypothetical protein|nr:hypothetical protein [Sphingobium sp. TCM1]
MGIGSVVEPIAGLELPQVTFLPAHRSLDYIVQHPEAAGELHVDGAPDLGFVISLE